MSYTAPPEVGWTQSHKADPNRIGLLDLPRELRDLIYEFAFLVSGAIFVYSSDAYHVRRNARAAVVRHKNEGPLEPQSLGRRIPIALLRTCRQVHAEGSPVVFGRNTFRLYASNADFAPRYRAYVRHILFTTDSMIQKIFDTDREIVSYWWRRHFWPDIIHKSTRLLQTYPNLVTLTFPIKSSRQGETWRPAFMASEQKTRAQRVAVAAAWLKVNCPFEDQRLLDCLYLEIVPAVPPKTKESDLASSRYLDEEWDCSEFEEAFKRMKV